MQHNLSNSILHGCLLIIFVAMAFPSVSSIENIEFKVFNFNSMFSIQRTLGYVLFFLMIAAISVLFLSFLSFVDRNLLLVICSSAACSFLIVTSLDTTAEVPDIFLTEIACFANLVPSLLYISHDRCIKNETRVIVTTIMMSLNAICSGIICAYCQPTGSNLVFASIALSHYLFYSLHKDAPSEVPIIEKPIIEINNDKSSSQSLLEDMANLQNIVTNTAHDLKTVS